VKPNAFLFIFEYSQCNGESGGIIVKATMQIYIHITLVAHENLDGGGTVGRSDRLAANQSLYLRDLVELHS
jgi:hypothetical protein